MELSSVAVPEITETEQDVHIAGELLGLCVVAPALWFMAEDAATEDQRTALRAFAVGTAAIDGWLLYKHAARDMTPEELKSFHWKIALVGAAVVAGGYYYSSRRKARLAELEAELGAPMLTRSEAIRLRRKLLMEGCAVTERLTDVDGELVVHGAAVCPTDELPSNPLKRGTTRRVVSENIRELMREGYPQEQAVAMSLEACRRSGGGEACPPR